MKRKLRIAVSALTVASMIASSFTSVSFADEADAAVEVSEDAAEAAQEAEETAETEKTEAVSEENANVSEDTEAVSEEVVAVEENTEVVSEEATAVEEDTEAVSEKTAAVDEETEAVSKTSGSDDAASEESADTFKESVTLFEAPTLTNAVAGETYTADFAALYSGTEYTDYKLVNNTVSKTFGDGVLFGEGTILVSGEGYLHDGQHGAAINPGDVIKVSVAGNAAISFTACKYNGGSDFVITNTAGEQVGTLKSVTTDDATVVTANYVGAADVLTIKYSGDNAKEAYVHKITVANAEASATPIEAIDYEVFLENLADSEGNVGNFGEGNTAILEGTGNTITLIKNSSTPAWTKKTSYDVDVNGTTKKLAYYTGGARQKANAAEGLVAEARGVVATNGQSVVFTSPAEGLLTLYVYVPNGKTLWVDDITDPANIVKVDVAGEVYKYYLSAKTGHKYVFHTGGTDGIIYAGFAYEKSTPVDVNVTVDGTVAAGESIQIIDDTINKVVDTITANKTVTLTKNHKYSAKFSTIDKKAVMGETGTITCSAATTAVTIKVTDTAPQTVTGSLTSSDKNSGDFDASKITAITLKSMDADYSNVSYTITQDESESGKINVADKTYSIKVKPGDYATVVTTEGGEYVTKDHVSVPEGADATNEIYCIKVDVGGPANYATDEEIKSDISSLTFTNMKYHSGTYGVSGGVGASIVVPVKADQSVKISGAYDGKFSIVGNGTGSTAVTTEGDGGGFTATYNTLADDTQVTITVTETGNFATGSGAAYIKSINVTSLGDDATPFASTIKVPGDYDTITEALTAIKSMNRPEGADGRVTIELTADIQEQVHVDVDYITINGNGHEINWYYGTDAKYYSVDSAGYYNEALFRDKYTKSVASGSLWGGVVIVDGDYFQAYDTTFRNTFNYEVTDKEIADGAISKGVGLRNKNSNVLSNTDKERSNALYTNGKHGECYNCKILSSQDTLGVNGDRPNNYWYFKDCTIGGNVDYICGAGTMIFDNCELQWKTYVDDNGKRSTGDFGGYLTAPQSGPYIMKDCTITTDIDESDSETAKDITGKYTRAWGATISRGYLINTETNGHLLDTKATWGTVGNGSLEKADYYQYGNTSNGEPFSMYKYNDRVGVTVTDEEEIANLTDTNKLVSAYLNGYTPAASFGAGDITATGTVTATAAAAIYKYARDNSTVFPGVSKGIMTKDFALKLADVDSSTVIDASDAAAVLCKARNPLAEFSKIVTSDEAKKIADELK